MDDMSGLLSQNFGIRPQGKSAPMAASKTASTNRSVPSSTSWTNQPADSFDDLFNPTASSPPSSSANNRSTTVNQSHDPILDTFNKGPVFDTPVYDDEDIFNGVPGIRSSSNLKYDDVFVSGSSDRGRVTSPPPYDDLLGSLGRGSGASDRQHGAQSPQAYDDLLGGLGTGKGMDGKHRGSAEAKDSGLSGFEDLLPGFGSSSAAPQPKREVPETDLPKPPKPPTADPFFVVGTGTSTGSFTDPLDHFAKPEPTKMDTSSPTTDNFFSENPNSFDSMPSFQSPGSSFTETNVPLQSNKTRDSSPINANNQSSFDDFENISIGKSKFAVEEQSPEPSEHSETGDDIWLTVSEIPLFTKPTNAPPPSRPPPSLSSSKQKFKGNYSYQKDEEFGFDDGEMERSSAAMKDAMSKAELKFKHAKEVREKMAKSKEAEQQEREDEEIDKQEREREEREKERRRIEEEKRRVEKQERDRGKQAVERATREARERASSDAILKSQRAAVLRAQQEARERAGQDARDRVAHEAKEREKAEREAKERAEREREAKERAERAERERKMQRAAVEKAASEARERLAQAAKEKHQQNQRKSEPTPSPAKVPPPPAKVPPPPAAQDDFDSIFGMGGSGPRPTSVPKRNPTPQESQAQNRAASASANIRKTSSTNMMDDLSAIFGGAPSSSGEFQEIDGETEDRRKARFEREMRTRDRAIKALAEKNARDMQVQHEQNERSRIGETLDFEIKRWAAGKEGNLRSLLSSLHYILWPECGWQPVSMADLITGASVKKVYRKATLCIHPDKVQQKGATLQQKYISEKVFDILKEAWNKFNSEELF